MRPSLYIRTSCTTNEAIVEVCLATAFPLGTTIVSNRTSAASQGEVLGVYQAIAAAAMGLSPLFLGSAVGAYPGLTAWGGALFLLLSATGFWLGRARNLQKTS